MKKFFDKEPIWFAVVWIIVYVLAFGNADSLSLDLLGIPMLLTVPVGLILSLVLYGFIRKNRLQNHVGLCRISRYAEGTLFFLPLVLISSVNFWGGVQFSAPPLHILLHIVSMCFVAFLEELIFRGLLFQGIRRSGLTAAILVSSLTFGAGHIVNLAFGAPLVDTLLQLVYAAAIGFCYTAVFYTTESILSCILSHAFVNATTVFAAEAGGDLLLFSTVVQTVLGISYGIWLFYCQNRRIRRAVSRIREMEVLFDRLCDEMLHPHKKLPASLAGELSRLTDYYTNGQWQHDYTLDENGLLPKDVKRGVLSEDGVYNLLEHFSRQN